MYCRLGYRQAESCKHWRTFRELRSSENLWPLLCLSWNLIAKIVNPPISHGIRMLRMFCFMTKHTLLGLGCVFLLWTHASGRFGTFCVPKCCTIRNLPRKSESCNEIRRFLPWFLISWQVLAASAFQYPTVCMIKESVRLTLYRPRGFLLAKSWLPVLSTSPHETSSLSIITLLYLMLLSNKSACRRQLCWTLLAFSIDTVLIAKRRLDWTYTIADILQPCPQSGWH